MSKERNERTKKMTPQEMTEVIYQIFDQAWGDRDTTHYGELMVAAYNLWTLLCYDFDVQEPPYDEMLKDDVIKERQHEEFVF